MTFENNEIFDTKGLCAVFKYLKHFEKLESLNFRCNKNFDELLVKALGEGITLKKELRVSVNLVFILNIDRRPRRKRHNGQRNRNPWRSIKNTC